MKTVRMDFGIEKLGLSFSSGGIPVVLDLTDLKRDPTLTARTASDWMAGNFLCLEMSFVMGACSDFLCQVGRRKMQAVQKQLSRAIWNPATSSCCRSETNWSCVGRFHVMYWWRSKRKSLLLFDLPVLVS